MLCFVRKIVDFMLQCCANFLKINKGFQFPVIPQTCRYKGRKFECGLSISCVLGGGKPIDLCSGGMIWSCCIDRDFVDEPEEAEQHNSIQNASEYPTFDNKMIKTDIKWYKNSSFNVILT